MTSVLYDAPGPKAKVRNLFITAAFGVIAVAAIWWVWSTLAETDQLDGDKWEPFLTSGVWTNYLLPGLRNTLTAAGLSLVLALPLGALLAMGRMSDHAWLRVPSSVLVELFRAIPVLLMMVFFKQLFVIIGFGAADQRPLFAVVTGLVFYNSAVLAEVFRSGVLSLPKGQTEASLAIGLRKGQYMRMILLPQALTAMLPAIVSQLVVIVKDTALGYQLTLLFPELLGSASTITGQFQNPVATYTVIAIIFVVVNFILTGLASRLERWMRQRRGGRAKGVVATAGLPGGGLADAPELEREIEQTQRPGTL